MGTVHDQNNHPIAGAVINAAGQKSATQRNLVTDDTGSFVLAELVPDTYSVSASCDTCSDASSIVEVGAGQARSIQIELHTDSASTVVSLETQGTTLDTISAKLGMNVASTEIQSLPVNGRTFSALALTAPLATNSGGAQFSALRFAGQSSEQNRYTLDGIDSSSVVSAEPSFLPIPGYEFQLRNSLESVDEFRVDSAAYSVEDGFGSGGQIKLVSKAGSNTWHGSLFEFFRNDKLQASNFFDRGSKPELHLNRYGINVSGNIFKDKLFIASGFEALAQRVGVYSFETVPSASTRSIANATLLPALNTIPYGFSATADPEIDLAERQATARQNESNFSTRLDYLPSAKQRVFLRYSRSSGTLLTPDFTVTTRDSLSVSKPDQMIANWSYQLSPNTIYQVTGGINRSPTSISVTSGPAGLKGSRILVGQQAEGSFASPGDQIQITGTGYGSGASNTGRTYSLLNRLDWTKKAHSIQIGAELQAVRVPLSLTGGITYHFRDVDSFLNNEDADIVYTGTGPAQKIEGENYGGYVQDSWRLNDRTQITLGLRYEYFSAPREQQNHTSFFDYHTFTSQPIQGAFYGASKLGFQPRAALTWSPKALRNTTVLRIGSGIYDGHNAFLDTLIPMENTSPPLFLQNAHFPMTPAEIISSGKAILSPRALDIGTFGLHQRNYLATASIQQALPHQLAVEADYAGIFSRHLTEQSVTNLLSAVDPVSGATVRQNNAYNAVPYLMNGGNSSYHALRLGLNRHLVDNLTLTASYALSHSIGNTQGAGEASLLQNPLCLACERSDNDFDVRQTFAANFVYQVPFGKGHRHLRSGIWSSLLGGWAAAGAWNIRSGLPLNVLIDRADEIYYSPGSRQYYSPSSALPPDAVALINAPYGLEGFGAFRPDYVYGVNPYTKSSTQWLNPAAFATPAPGRLGNLGRNALRGPGFQQIDFQLSRFFVLRDNIRMELRGEAFNLFNHPNFNNPSNVLPDSTVDIQPGQAYTPELASGFGVLTSTVGRTVGLGTSRQFQLSVRLQF